jgi:xanthine/CO dehydrogenase XdhC/CoxF family maturation factor
MLIANRTNAYFILHNVKKARSCGFKVEGPTCRRWSSSTIINGMKELYRTLADLLQQGTPVALATITSVRGSVPREVGTKMIVHPYGQHVGTVGGGCGEGDVIRAGLLAIHTGEPQRVEVDLTEEISMQSLGVCGGVMEVFVEPFRPVQG